MKGLFDFFKPRAAAQDRSPWGSFWFSANPGGMMTTPASAMGLPVVYSCIKVLAESFAVMPFKLYKPKVDGSTRGKQVRQHWVVRLFNRRPNKFQTPYEWRLMLMGHLALRGNAFNQITANGAGEITDLLPLHPDRMKIEMLPSGEYRYRYAAQDGTTIYYRRDEIWHLRTMSEDGIVGISPIEMGRDAVSEGLAMQSYSKRFFANDAKPGGGWIEFPGSFSNSTDKQSFRDSWQELQGGENRGKVAVLEKGMKFHELTLNNSDAQFIEARAAKISDICRIFRVPPHMVSDLSRATFSNIEQQSIDFWTNTMLPWAVMWESSIEYFLLGDDTKFETEFDMKRMLRGDSAARTAFYNGGINAGWLLRNEARDAEGLDPIEGLDEPLVPLNMIPVSDTSDAEARFLTLVTGNAQRMARRIAGGNPPTAGVLAEALAIPSDQAAQWLATWNGNRLSENDLTASLLEAAQ